MRELRERILHYVVTLFQFPLLKALGAETAIISNVFVETRPTLFLVLVLSFMDLITGIGVSIKYKRVSSWGLRQTVLKLSIYILLVLLGSLVHQITGIDWADSAFVGLIVMTEMISILENIQLMFPNVLPFSILNHFGIVIKKKKKRK